MRSSSSLLLAITDSSESVQHLRQCGAAQPAFGQRAPVLGTDSIAEQMGEHLLVSCSFCLRERHQLPAYARLKLGESGTAPLCTTTYPTNHPLEGTGKELSSVTSTKRQTLPATVAVPLLAGFDTITYSSRARISQEVR